MDQTPDQQEVLMARDNTSGKVGAVVGQNPDGTPKMADVKSTPLSELIKFNKGQNPSKRSCRIFSGRPRTLRCSAFQTASRQV